MGVRLNFCPAFVYAGLGPVVARARVLVHDVLDRGAQPLFAAALVMRCSYLIAVPGRCPRRRSLCVAGT
jgi:hypothetical protein